MRPYEVIVERPQPYEQVSSGELLEAAKLVSISTIGIVPSFHGIIVLLVLEGSAAMITIVVIPRSLGFPYDGAVSKCAIRSDVDGGRGLFHQQSGVLLRPVGSEESRGKPAFPADGSPYVKGLPAHLYGHLVHVKPFRPERLDVLYVSYDHLSIFQESPEYGINGHGKELRGFPKRRSHQMQVDAADHGAFRMVFPPETDVFYERLATGRTTVSLYVSPVFRLSKTI